MIGGLTGGTGDGVGSGSGGAATTVGVVSGGVESMFGGGAALAGVVVRGVGTRGGRAGEGAGAAASAATGAGAAGAASRAINGAAVVPDPASSLGRGNSVTTYQLPAACTKSDSSTARLNPEWFRIGRTANCKACTGVSNSWRG